MPMVGFGIEVISLLRKMEAKSGYFFLISKHIENIY